MVCKYVGLVYRIHYGELITQLMYMGTEVGFFCYALVGMLMEIFMNSLVCRV